MSMYVYVLGAGSSMPFGFPSGAALKKDILHTCGLVDEKNIKVFEMDKVGRLQSRRQLLHNQFSEGLKNEFARSFQRSGQYSIDVFIRNRPEFSEIAKVCIASVLFDYERQCNLMSLDQQDWLSYFFNRLGMTSNLDMIESTVFITFNYDRVVEYFFYTALKNSLGRADHEVQPFLEKLKVLHVHGSLGNAYPWQPGYLVVSDSLCVSRLD